MSSMEFSGVVITDETVETVESDADQIAAANLAPDHQRGIQTVEKPARNSPKTVERAEPKTAETVVIHSPIRSR
eukprot:226014-Karenia_brevis.AAC.1